MKETTKINNVKDLYSQLVPGTKTATIKLIADDFGLNPQYVRGHWFSAFWTIPEKHINRVIELLQNTIINQK